MINEVKTRMKCREDFSLIQNYDKAISDDTQVWDCHHRLGTVIPKKKLLEMDLYYNRPALELIFLTREEHIRLHHKDKKRTEETIKKLRESHKGKRPANLDTLIEQHKLYGSPIKGKHRVYDKNGKYHLEF